MALARRAIESLRPGAAGARYRPAVRAEQRRAGVFVSLHLPDGSLRGCIGTTEPHPPASRRRSCANAISAATRIPASIRSSRTSWRAWTSRWTCWGAAEEVSGTEELDPKRYGIIVRTIDGRRALLLPDLEGVDTVEQQMRITCRKGGIDPVGDQYRIYRFQVERHH